MKSNQIRLPHLIIAAIIFSALAWTAKLSAQVTIGDDALPRKGTILDMKRTNPDSHLGGLLLPNVEITSLDSIPTGFSDASVMTPVERDVNPGLAGLIVYNTNAATGTGLFLWDGNVWQQIFGNSPYSCDALYPVPTNNNDKTAKFITSSNDTLIFLTYNLGADPRLTPYEQMTYTRTGTTAASEIPYDVRINGGLFQWGRKDFRHAFRCQKESGVNDYKFSTVRLNYPTVDDDGRFVFGQEDWVSVPQDNLWDSTKLGYTRTEDPCPTGFTVPNEGQWTALFDVMHFGDGDIQADERYAWIPVRNGVWRNDFTGSGTFDDAYYNRYSNNGIAIYTASAYTEILTKANGTDLSDPESFSYGVLQKPVLFLPAAGARHSDNGYVVYHGMQGAYWCSNSSILGFESNNKDILPGYYRANGFSVRCVKGAFRVKGGPIRDK